MQPDYHNSIVNLAASLAAGFGAPAGLYPPLTRLPPTEVAAAGHAVLLIVDGLGYDYVRAGGGPLAEHLLAPLSSVFPSSTAPAITSLMTATAPQQHAVTGWQMLLHELGAITLLLPFRLRCGVALGDPGPTATAAGLIGAPSLFDRTEARAYSLLPEALADSCYSRATAGRARRVAYRTLAELPGLISAAIDAGAEPALIVAYWPQFDALCHGHGVASAAAARHYRQLSQAFVELHRRLRGRDALLLLSADHGFIDSGPDRAIDLTEHRQLYDCLALPLSGEPRAAFCHLRPGCEERFEDYVNEVLGAYLDCRPSRSLIEQGWFGSGEADPRLRRRVGDYVLIGRDNYVVYDRIGAEPSWSLIGIHGGLSEAEMRVPLILTRCA